jgi:hypothetical protein
VLPQTFHFINNGPLIFRGPADIYFRINDNDQSDNSGYLTVEAKQK